MKKLMYSLAALIVISVCAATNSVASTITKADKAYFDVGAPPPGLATTVNMIAADSPPLVQTVGSVNNNQLAMNYTAVKKDGLQVSSWAGYTANNQAMAMRKKSYVMEPRETVGGSLGNQANNAIANVQSKTFGGNIKQLQQMLSWTTAKTGDVQQATTEQCQNQNLVATTSTDDQNQECIATPTNLNSIASTAIIDSGQQHANFTSSVKELTAAKKAIATISADQPNFSKNVTFAT